MFISYTMFIFLIILTIIMIALIVYLTFTAKGPKKEKRPTNTPIVSPEDTQNHQQPIEPFHLPASSLENKDNNDSNEQSDHYPFNQSHTSNATQADPHHSDSNTNSEQSIFEDELYVLPYPKEENKEDETIYTTSIFRRSFQDKSELTSNSEKQNSKNQE